jgi:hypothetical protein
VATLALKECCSPREFLSRRVAITPLRCERSLLWL